MTVMTNPYIYYSSRMLFRYYIRAMFYLVDLFYLNGMSHNVYVMPKKYK